MLKLCVLFLLITTSAYSNDDTGPTLPLVKEVHNKEESRMHMGLNLGVNNSEGTRGAFAGCCTASSGRPSRTTRRLDRRRRQRP